MPPQRSQNAIDAILQDGEVALRSGSFERRRFPYTNAIAAYWTSRYFFKFDD